MQQVASPRCRAAAWWRTTLALIAVALSFTAACGDTNDPTSPAAPSSTSTSTDTYNDTDNDGEQPAEDTEIHEGTDPESIPDGG
jgi:hypothetical protein